MKKIIAAILCFGIVAAVSAGCGYKDALEKNADATQTSETETKTAAVVDEAKPSDFKDSLDGLCSYFEKLEYFALKDGKIDESKVTKMDASLIGAKAGKKFMTSYGGKAVTIELYEYEIQKLNDKAKEIIASVKNDGTFSILDLPKVKAYLSDSGKYLMIYTDASINDKEPDKKSDNFERREEVIKNFQKF